MTRTVEMEAPEHGNTPTNVISSDGTDRDGNYSSKTQDAVCNESGKLNQNFGSDSSKLQTNKMTNFMDDLSLNSPKERPSRSRSKTRSISRRSSRSTSSSSSGSSTSCSSRSSSRGRAQCPSHDRKYRQKRSRKSSSSSSCSRSRSYSRSCSRSRSRSYSPRQRRRYSSAYRRYYRSPSRYRSRSRSRSFRGRLYSRSRSPSHRRFYGFARRPYSPTFRSWRSRSRTHSRSRTPLRLSEKEKLNLLEIAKMNASKALGKEVELPDSLKKITEGLKNALVCDERILVLDESAIHSCNKCKKILSSLWAVCQENCGQGIKDELLSRMKIVQLYESVFYPIATTITKPLPGLLRMRDVFHGRYAGSGYLIEQINNHAAHAREQWSSFLIEQILTTLHMPERAGVRTKK